MLSYLGPFGGLIGFRCPSALSVEPGERSNFKRTLDGVMHEQRGPRGRRKWSVDIGTATPAEVSMLGALVDGFYGPPPWVWVGPWAAITNLFSPGQSLLDSGTYSTGSGITAGGAGITAGGLRYGRSVNTPGTSVSLHFRDKATDRLPVLPGVPVTASVYASGGASVRLDFVDAFGGLVSQVNGAAGSGTMTRRTVTATPPSLAAGVQVVVVGASSLTLPAFTWTPQAQPWSPGRGSNRTTVDGLGEAVQLAVAGSPGLQRSATTFTVQEIG